MNNKRLEAIYHLFDCPHIIDIGSDHGYLPLELLKNNKVETALIVEVNQGPLDNAIRNTKVYGLNDKTKHVLSNGLLEINQDEIWGGIVIAGMGGKLIKEIIEQDLEKFHQAKLFLQPNNNEARLRQFLVNNGFKITKNILIKDDGIIYEIIVATSGQQKLDDEQILFGVDTEKSALFTEKWLNQKEYLEKLLIQIRSSGHKNEKMEQEYQKICEILGVKNEIE